MNLTLAINQYDIEYVYFCDCTKNNIMNNALFHRILYSTNSFTTNGLYFYIQINYNSIEKYYNKYKCIFNVTNYQELIENLKYIEESILNKINIVSKQKILKIHEQLKNGIIKLFSNDNSKDSNIFILKIAGVWETEKEIGITYKFIKL